MKQKYVSPELKFIKVQTQDILYISENSTYVPATPDDDPDGGIFA